MPKCRSCNNRVNRSLTKCPMCGVWTPDKKAFQLKMALIIGLAVALGIFLFFLFQEVTTNAEERARQNELIQ